MSDEEKKRKHEQDHEGEEPTPKRNEPSQPLTDSSQDPPPQVPPGG